MFPVCFAQMIIKPQQQHALEGLCPGEEVVITCETRGSLIIAWASEEYIGYSLRLAFTSVHLVGDTRISPMNPNTVATLIKSEMDGNVQVLQSKLRIIASINSTVMCINVANDRPTSRRIQILGMHQLKFCV